MTKPLNEALIEAAWLLQATMATVTTLIFAIPFNRAGYYYIGLEDVMYV